MSYNRDIDDSFLKLQHQKQKRDCLSWEKVYNSFIMRFESRAGRTHTGVHVEPAGFPQGIVQVVRERGSDHNQLQVGTEGYDRRMAAGVSGIGIPREFFQPTGDGQGQPERSSLLRSIEAKGDPGGLGAVQPSGRGGHTPSAELTGPSTQTGYGGGEFK